MIERFVADVPTPATAVIFFIYHPNVTFLLETVWSKANAEGP